MLEFITLPSTASTTAGITTYTDMIFSNLFTVALAGVGIVLGGAILAFLVKKVVQGTKKVLGGRRGGRRRGR